MKNVFQIGQVVTCQFGNKNDSRGFTASADVVVLGSCIKKDVDFPLYLVKRIGDRNGVGMVARAILPPPGSGIQTDLYTTAAICYGSDDGKSGIVVSLEEAVQRLF